MKEVAVVTGTRAEYGYLQPLMKAIKKDKSLKLTPIITGMHLLPDFGNTYKLVKKEFPESVKVKMDLEGDTLNDMANYLSSGIKNFSKYFSKKKPKIIVVLGDRSEALAAALAATYLNIPIAHINGGDVSGAVIDNTIRNIISTISQIHFVHTKENGKRLEQMGVDKKNIFVVGALTIDTILSKKLKTKKEVFKNYKLDENKRTFLVVQHPIPTSKDSGLSEMKELFLALNSLKEQTIMLYPNCDAGGKKRHPLVRHFPFVQGYRARCFHPFENGQDRRRCRSSQIGWQALLCAQERQGNHRRLRRLIA